MKKHVVGKHADLRTYKFAGESSVCVGRHYGSAQGQSQGQENIFSLCAVGTSSPHLCSCLRRCSTLMLITSGAMIQYMRFSMETIV